MHVVICGGGFAGLTAAKKLAKKCEVTLIDKKPAFEYVPSLPFVVSRKKQRLDIITNYNQFAFKNAINFVQDRVIKIDHTNKTVICEKQQIKFDKCVIALGSVTNTFGIPGIAEHGLYLKDVDDAEKIQARIEYLLKEGKFHFVVCGAGLTGIELVAEIKILVDSLQQQYGFSAGEPKVILVEALPEIMPGFSENAVKYAREVLEKENVKILANSAIVNYSGSELTFKDGRTLPADLVVWVAGVRPNPILRESNLKLNERGAILVNQQLQTETSPEVYAIGDNIFFVNQATQKPVLPTAQYAEQQADVVVHNIIHDEKKVYIPAVHNPILLTIGNTAIYVKNKQIMRGKIPLFMKSIFERVWLLRHR